MVEICRTTEVSFTIDGETNILIITKDDFTIGRSTSSDITLPI